MTTLLALEFPEIGEILDWPDFFDGAGFNKIALINVMAVVLTLGIFLLGGRRKALVPTGVQNFAEASIDFIRDGVVVQTMGRDGLSWVPFLTAMFFFIFFNNITGILPFFQMPATARMATPLVLALIVWVIFNFVGVWKQGPLHYLKNTLVPPGVPWPLIPLVAIIEFVSVFLVRPFSLAVRLFANMLAGHILLVTFAILTDALITADSPILVPVGVLPFIMLFFMTAFEVMVAFLQAYIFVVLTGVYVGGAIHPAH